MSYFIEIIHPFAVDDRHDERFEGLTAEEAGIKLEDLFGGDSEEHAEVLLEGSRITDTDIETGREVLCDRSGD